MADPEDSCNVPSYAHTLVGVGGMVVDEDNNVLVVQERFRFSNHWKLPGGCDNNDDDTMIMMMTMTGTWTPGRTSTTPPSGRCSRRRG